MNYTELQNSEMAFFDFLLKIKRKTEIEVKYYQFLGKYGKYDISYIGYRTNEGGRHGIHYNHQRRAYSFGTRAAKGGSWIVGLTYPQIDKISEYLKEAFFDVANTKIRKVIKNHRPDRTKLNELI